MQFTKEIQRLLAGFMVVFGLVILSAAYWAVVGTDTILERSDNPRLVEAQAAIVRGDILDRNETPLVTSVQDEYGRVSRDFIYPAMNSIAGYYSLRYGVGGIEAAYNTILRGDDLPKDLNTYFNETMLHRPQHGSDVRLSLDVAVQQAVFKALDGHKGAAVVLSVPSGEILSMVSLPTFDPNQLDSTWEQLVADPEKPFFNRALQGRYQPGGILQTPLITAALLAEYPLDQPIANATQPFELDGLPLSCAIRPPENQLTLAGAYAFACPVPFVRLFEQADRARLQEAFELFRLDIPYNLPDFVAETPVITSTLTPVLTPTVTPAASKLFTLENALGQGNLTLSPLDVAAMTASIVNEGNAPQPLILLETRKPGLTEWTPVSTIYPSTPVMTSEISRRLQELMRQATRSGSAQDAARDGMNIGGHAALAYSGETTYAWFTGFIITGTRQGIVVALVLEDNDDPTQAAAIGGQILEAAFNRSLTPVQQP